MGDEFTQLDKFEQAGELQAWLREFSRIYMQHPAEERAYRLIREFYKVERPGDEAYEAFIVWLMSGEEAEAKGAALERVFREKLR